MPQTAEELLAALREMLKTSTDATPADVLAGIKTALDSAKTPSDKSTLPNEEVKKLTGSITDLMKAVKEQGETIKLLSTTQETSERGSIMAAAAAAGKQVPSMAKSLPIDQLKLLCAELPVTVPVGQRQTDSTLMLSGLTPSVDPEIAKLDASMGISADDRTKYLGKA